MEAKLPSLKKSSKVKKSSDKSTKKEGSRKLSKRKSLLQNISPRGMRPLRNREYEKLKWTKTIQFPGLIRIRTDADGSCFFHAVAKAYFKPYITGKTKDGTPLDRKKFIRSLRKDFSKMLANKVDPKNPKSKTWYETMANGEWPRISKKMKEYTLESMQKELNSNASISNIYNEFISDQLDKDIYILDANKQDVYMTGTDDSLLYKQRTSIVILYLPGHYELVGIEEDGYIQTTFQPDSPLIQLIRNRMEDLTNI